MTTFAMFRRLALVYRIDTVAHSNNNSAQFIQMRQNNFEIVAYCLRLLVEVVAI